MLLLNIAYLQSHMNAHELQVIFFFTIYLTIYVSLIFKNILSRVNILYFKYDS